MALPELTLPPSVPTFVVASQQADESDVYGTVDKASGHSRRRRLRTIPERRVKVASKPLTQLQAALFDDWFETALDVGSRPFSVLLTSNVGAGNLWWSAIWLAKPTQEPSSARWVFTGELVLSGAGSVTPPVSTSLYAVFRVELDATAAILADVALQVRYSASLTLDAPLFVRYAAILEIATPEYLLIGDGFHLVIGDGKRLRIG